MRLVVGMGKGVFCVVVLLLLLGEACQGGSPWYAVELVLAQMHLGMRTRLLLRVLRVRRVRMLLVLVSSRLGTPMLLVLVLLVLLQALLQLLLLLPIHQHD